MPSILQTRYVADFVCLGAKCEDTCCQGWGMQVDNATCARYAQAAPELLDAVVEGETAHVMKRDAETDRCVKLQNGLCGIHAQYGTDFLGDACHFYPRVTRDVSGHLLMTATLSCPEAARLALFGADPFTLTEHSINRLPESLLHYAQEDLTAQSMLNVHSTFLQVAGGELLSPEHMLARLVSVSHSLQYLATSSWAEAVPFYFEHAAARMPGAMTHVQDPFNLYHMLSALIHAARKSPRLRLSAVLNTIAAQLNIRFDMENFQLQLSATSHAEYQRVSSLWYETAATVMAPMLRRYVQAQLSVTFFPFSGLGNSITQRAQFLAIRFSLVKLALMARCAEVNTVLTPAQCVEVIQPISRFMDHLASADLALSMFKEADWQSEARLRGLLEDC